MSKCVAPKSVGASTTVVYRDGSRLAFRVKKKAPGSYVLQVGRPQGLEFVKSGGRDRRGSRHEICRDIAYVERFGRLPR